MVTTSPLYRHRWDPSTFALAEAVLDQNIHPIRVRPLSSAELARRAKQAHYDQTPQALAFYVACLTLTTGEVEHRRAVERLGSRRTRNIKLNLSTAAKCLELEMLRILPSKGELSMNLASLLQPALEPIRAALSLPMANPVKYSYVIDDRLLAQITNEPCKQELERVRASCKGILFPREYEALRASLKEKFPDEATKAIDALKQTQTREHLAALSLSTGKGGAGETYVSLANAHGQLLTLEGWKLLRLIEDHQHPHQLAKLSELLYQEPNSQFAFDRLKSGEVIAQLDPQASVITVVCRNEKNHQQVDGRASFIVDLDYLLCVYIALKRLREDRERFARLKEQAETAVCQDLFDKL